MVIVMRKKMWVASPLMYLAVFAMYIMTIISFNNNLVAFFVELGISIVFTISLIFVESQFWFRTKMVLKSAKSVLLTENEQALNEIGMPIVVTGFEGDIIWANNTFSSLLGGENNVLGDTVLKYIYPKTLRQISSEQGSNIHHKDKKFTVYSVKTESSYILYFIDDTYFKNIHKEFTEKKPVVTIISFDNKEELIRDASGGEESRITSEVESCLRDWTSEMGGFIRKLSDNKYIMISDEIHMEKAKTSKFHVLDNVREIKNTRNMSATISVGIGRDSNSVKQSEQWAKKGLEIALGRGGDQVAIVKKGDVYEFFGGVSKGVEKRDKVRSRVIATALTDRIKASDKVLIMGHKNSDLDSMGAAIGIWAVTKKGLNKHCHIIVNENQSLAMPLIQSMYQAYPNEKVFISPHESLQEITSKTTVIVVDTHSAVLSECTEILSKSNNIVIIDHHRMMVNHIQNSVIFYHEPYASSASEMVAELVQYIDVNSISQVEAQALLAGISLDTKNFILKTGVRTFEASAFLRQRGADMVQVKKYFSNSISTYREKASFVSSADIYNGCAVSCGVASGNTTRISAAQAADELLSIQGVKASFVLFDNDTEIIISARSLGEINVQIILEEFGGGGHLTMAGAQIKGLTIEEAKSSLIAVIHDKLS